VKFISGDDCTKCQIFEFDESLSTTVSILFPMVFGEWTALAMDFASVISINRPRGSDSIDVDFGHTIFSMGGVIVDEFGNELSLSEFPPGAFVQAISGTHVSNTVPTAPTAALLIVGFGISALRTARSIRQRLS
jgi:hypothetical protein